MSTFQDGGGDRDDSVMAMGEEGGFWEDDGPRGGGGARGALRSGEGLGLLPEEDDEMEWMEGVDVDPEAEAIFYGDRAPFSDLGEREELL